MGAPSVYRAAGGRVCPEDVSYDELSLASLYFEARPKYPVCRKPRRSRECRQTEDFGRASKPRPPNAGQRGFVIAPSRHMWSPAGRLMVSLGGPRMSAVGLRGWGLRWRSHCRPGGDLPNTLRMPSMTGPRSGSRVYRQGSASQGRRLHLAQVHHMHHRCNLTWPGPAFCTGPGLVRLHLL